MFAAAFMLRDDLAALIARAERFLDAMEQCGRGLTAEESERLAELLVNLGAGRLDEGAASLQQLETLVTHVRERATPGSRDLPTIVEYRVLFELVKSES